MSHVDFSYHGGIIGLPLPMVPLYPGYSPEGLRTKVRQMGALIRHL